jgi:hypothetical protein
VSGRGGRAREAAPTAARTAASANAPGFRAEAVAPRVVSQAGANIRSMAHPAYLRETARALLVRRKLTIDELAERLALSRSTIYYWVRDLPIPIGLWRRMAGVGAPGGGTRDAAQAPIAARGRLRTRRRRIRCVDRRAGISRLCLLVHRRGVEAKSKPSRALQFSRCSDAARRRLDSPTYEQTGVLFDSVSCRSGSARASRVLGWNRGSKAQRDPRAAKVKQCPARWSRMEITSRRPIDPCK